MLLDFGDKNFILISGNGDSIKFFDRTKYPDPNDKPSETYSIKSIPAEYHKKIRYASKFVDLVRSKTAKVL